MKKIIILITLLLVGSLTNALIQVKAETLAIKTAVDSTDGEVMDKPGKHIRMVNIKGYTLMYHLLDLSERDKVMKMMSSHSVLGMSKKPDITNHLMVYVQDTKGMIVPGLVAYHLTDPEGNEFRTMTMGMYGGYGADVVFKLKGLHTIKTKIGIDIGEDSRLDDEFTYEVK